MKANNFLEVIKLANSGPYEERVKPVFLPAHDGLELDLQSPWRCLFFGSTWKCWYMIYPTQPTRVIIINQWKKGAA